MPMKVVHESRQLVDDRSITDLAPTPCRRHVRNGHGSVSRETSASRVACVTGDSFRELRAGRKKTDLAPTP
jgi:hypothetical protein